jgi:hypothetical protein
VRGESEQRVVFPDEITDAVLDSLDWYSLFPGGNFKLSIDWPSFDLAGVAKTLRLPECAAASLEDNIDKLTLALLVHGLNRLPGTALEWEILAENLSLLYIDGFKRLESRELRMKAQRANYYIRLLIDFHVEYSTEINEERSTGINYPWDLLFVDGGEVYIGSGEGENVFITSENFEQTSFRVALPTQLTKLGQKRIAVGSLYSDGWYEFGPRQNVVHYSHDCPVVLLFERKAEEYFLDVNGGIYAKATRQKMMQIAVHSAWRARCIDGTIFISDLAAAKTLVTIKLEEWTVAKVDIGPVLLMNDLCSAPGGYYLIDKMQGRIFKFDSKFKFLTSKLGFGTRYGCISDPISLSIHDGKIHILSWLGNKVTIMDKF